MPVSVLPDEILDLTFKELIPPFRSEALTEIYVFDTPVDLLRLRLVSRRFCRIATPLAWRRVQLRICDFNNDAVETQGSWSSLTSWSGGSLGDARGNPEELDHATSSCTPHSYPHNGAAAADPNSQFKSSAADNNTSPLPALHFLFFQDRPELAAHVRVLFLSVEYQAEGSGSESGASGSGFDFAYDDGGEFDSGFGTVGVGVGVGVSVSVSEGVGDRRGSSSSSSSAVALPAQSSSSWYLGHALRAATRGMTGLRTILLWDSSTTTGLSSSSTTTDIPSNVALNAGGMLVREVMSFCLRAPLMRVLSLRDVDGAAFPASSVHYDGGRNRVHEGGVRLVGDAPSDINKVGVCEGSGSNLETAVIKGMGGGGGLKMLHLSNAKCPSRIITSPSIGQSLEVLSIELARPDIADFADDSTMTTVTGNPSSMLVPTPAPTSTATLRDMPWSTLKEVSLFNCVDKQDWCHFLTGFQVCSKK